MRRRELERRGYNAAMVISGLFILATIWKLLLDLFKIDILLLIVIAGTILGYDNFFSIVAEATFTIITSLTSNKRHRRTRR